MTVHRDEQEAAAAADEATPPARMIRAEELFGADREIWIEHNGERYRLRITRRNKLILQK